MADDQDISPFDDDNSATQILQGLISPAPAQALVASPPDTAPPTKPGESTPLTGSLRTAPSQASPKRLPGSDAEQTRTGTRSATQALAGSKIRRGLARYFSSGVSAPVSSANSGAPALMKSNAPDHNGTSAQTEASAVAGTPAAIGAPAAIGWKGAKAARADAREPALKTQILSATNRTQPVGATEAQSGRRITQPTDNPAVNQALATDAMREYRAGLESAVKEIPGAKLAASRNAKNPRRLAEKIVLEGQPPETVSDYGAAQISVASPQAKDAVIAAVKKRFPVVRVQDNFAKGDPEYGYRSYSMQLRMPNGASQELQIVPREVFEVNYAEHKKYKEARDAKLAGKNAGAIEAAAKKENDSAMAKFNLRNRARSANPALAPDWRQSNSADGLANQLRKGAAIALPDGTRATILYLDPNMKIARVRTAAGKNLTVRRQDLRRWETQQGESGLGDSEGENASERNGSS